MPTRGAILIHADSLRADHLGAYGGEIHTPNLDRLAAEGTVFERNYAASYPTVPNRHDIWTGRYNFLERGWTDLQPEETTLPELLGDGAVSAFVFDTPMLQGHGFHEGFDGWHRERGHHGDAMRTAPATPDLPAAPHKISRLDPIDRYLRNSGAWEYEREFIAPRTMAAAAEWLEDNRGEDRPFCLVVDAWDPHEPFDAPRHHVDRYDDTPPDTEEVIYPAYGRPAYLTDDEHDHVRARYAAEVSMVDHAVGRVLDAVDRLDLRDETLVAFTSDHGHLFGEHDLQGKPTGSLGRLYEESIHTPLLLRHPDRGGGERVDALTQPVDLLPTLLDALGVPVPGDVHGESLLDLLDGGDLDREYVITARYTEGAETTATDFDGWRGQGGVTSPVTVTGDRFAYICHPDPDESELYDLAADPDQTADVSDDHPDVAAAMREHYLAFVREHDAVDVMREPFEPGGAEAYATRETVGRGAPVYYFEYRGDRYGHVDRAFAEKRAPDGAAVEETTFGEFVDATPDALVNVAAQYHYARELAA